MLSSFRMCSHSQDVTPSYFKQFGRSSRQSSSFAPAHEREKQTEGRIAWHPSPGWTHFWNLLANLIHHRWAVLMDTLEVSVFLPSNPSICVLCSTPPSRIYFISVYQRGLIFPNCHIIACPSQILPHPFVQIFARSEEVVLLLLRGVEPKINLYQIFYGNSYMATLFSLAGFY